MEYLLSYRGYFLKGRRIRRAHKEILLLLANGSSLRRTIFTFVCLITLVGSSFRPMPGPDFAKGSIGPDNAGLSESIGVEEEEDNGLYYSVYQVRKGDTVSGISDSFNVTIDTIFSLNNIQSARCLKPGQLLKIPNMSGIVYTAKADDTVAAIADTYGISADRLVEANCLMSDKLDEGKKIFLPDARMPANVVREISGDLFRWPVRGVITSWYAWRRDPFSGRNSFHNGLDIGVPGGTPIGSAMEGTVSETGYSPIMGRYVIVSHPGGWRTLYAHMSSILVEQGRRVSQGGRLGLTGNTGYSTGPHLHFSVFKNGKPVNPSNLLQ